MFKKIGFSEEHSIDHISNEDVLADPVLVSRMDKFANEIKSIAPKSDDFLYFSIIFLKSAEASLIDENGDNKKLHDGEKAWGYFDENWKWNGNVKPHRNNNGDIFPEVELKKAAKDWIGMPLCRDHESSSVDGIRGIILDTHYDNKLKQVVGLCALDRVNYPDLARKVETGLVRYGSMGTAVETSVCSECQNKATTQDEYCEHILGKTAHGEINVGLSPIEYSLVVQPAEPGAKLLRCIASLRDYQKEFINYGVEDIDKMLGSLNEKQAVHLESIMKTACGENGCSVPERKRIVSSFLKNNNLLSQTSSNDVGAIRSAVENINLDELSKIVGLRNSGSDSNDPEYSKLADDISKRLLEEYHRQLGLSAGESADDRLSLSEDSGVASGEVFTTNENSQSSPIAGMVPVSDGQPKDYTGTGALGEFGAASPDVSERSEGDFYAGGVPLGDKGPQSLLASKKQNKTLVQSLLEDIMNESKLRKRAELRRRVAYHQGGADGVEPSDYKSESFDRNQDKQMQQGGNLGGDNGMVPGDKEVKEKYSRAAYNGPALRTKFSKKTNLDGTINKAGSKFQVLAGNDIIIEATADDIFGEEIDENWDWITSVDYGKEVVRQIRESGVNYVAGLLKESQELPALPPMPEEGEEGLDAAEDEGALPPMPEMPEMPEVDEEPPALEEDDGDEALEDDPAKLAEEALANIEREVEELRALLDEMAGGDREVNVNVNLEEEGVDAEKLALANDVATKLKRVFAELNDSGNEFAMIVEAYDKSSRLSKVQKSNLRRLTNAAINDYNRISGQATSLASVAKSIGATFVKTSEYAEELDATISSSVTEEAQPSAGQTPENALIAEALEMRRARREALLKSAQDRVLQSRKSKREMLAKQALEADDAVMAAPAADMSYVEDQDNAVEDQDNAVEDQDNAADDMGVEASNKSILDGKISAAIEGRHENQEREAYKLKLRRAYDLAMDMQRKGLVSMAKSALDRQVDEIMLFDDRAFEAFKRSIANAKPISSTKIASDLGGINVGVESGSEVSQRTTIETLASLWD